MEYRGKERLQVLTIILKGEDQKKEADPDRGSQLFIIAVISMMQMQEPFQREARL
ncbi:MAG: hypothetical protein JXA44_03260 [Methanospirillaceae archaeon]|nr:hypothetical protein [Methanospirillaceae archaeon]